MFQKLPTLYYCKSKDSSKTHEFLISKGILAHEIFDGFMAWSLGVRMLVKCDFREIMLVNGICSLTKEMKVGDLFMPLDQLNLNAQSPQFGPNEDTWGKWFYDCSNYLHGVVFDT